MPYSQFKHVKFSAIAGVVPENYINIDDELEFYKNDPAMLERNKKILGLGTRYYVDENTTAVDLCEDAGARLIEKLNLDKSKIECLIFLSVTPDYLYPASSCILQGKLGLSENCMCFDMTGLACSGYVHGLINAHALIESKVVKNCLILCGDIASTLTDRRNRISNMLFSDAGTATYLEYTEKETLSYFYNGTNGTEWDKIVAPAGGKRLPVKKDILDIETVDDNGNVWHLPDAILSGMEVFKYTMEIGPKSIERLLKYASKTIDDIDFFAIHQANGQIVKTVGTHARLPKEKYSADTFKKYANCSIASVATVLLDKCKDKNNIFLCTFGVGLSFANGIIDFSNAKNFAIETYKPRRKNKTREEQIEYWINKFKGKIDE